MRQNFADIDRLADFLQLDKEQRKKIGGRSRFALNLPMRLAEKIVKGTLNDPILKQFLPTNSEDVDLPNFVLDAVGDTACKRSNKLLHKYNGRVLLVMTSACAMHCRYCFRQHFDYETADKTFDEELAIIAQDTTINEVILSGGDPLSLDTRVLASLLSRLSAIAHVRKIRFHTRFPIGIPERLDDAFIDMLKSCSQQIWFVIHVNHADELDEDVLRALKRVQLLGIPVLNQSVLLKGVNDDLEVLVKLCEKLIDNGVIPYYLHQLDKIQGAAHFEVPEEVGLQLIEGLRIRLPGYGVPLYVRETQGLPSKTPIS